MAMSPCSPADVDRSRFWSTVMSGPEKIQEATSEKSKNTHQPPSPALRPCTSTPLASLSLVTSDSGSETRSSSETDLVTLDTAEVLSNMKYSPRESVSTKLEPATSTSPDAFRRHQGPTRVIYKPYLCGEPGCSSRFSHVSSKYRHYRTVHLGRRDHQCEVIGCGLSFGERSGLTKHIQSVHAKIRKYACSWTGCSLRFSFRLHLQQHVQTVHLKQRPFHCLQCDSRFGQRSSLTRHVRQIHVSRQA